MHRPKFYRLVLCLAPWWAAAAQARTAPPMPVTLNFVAEVNGAPFDCNKTYGGVGLDKVRWQPQDFRFYVSDVALLQKDGSAVPVALVADGTWQTRDVALLDFEDRTGACQNGTPATNAKVQGTVPGGTQAVGVRFTVAVPFALNHADASTQDPPLDQAGLFWGWQLGYKFLTVEGKVEQGAAHVFHLGSTGCTMATPQRVTGCSAPNAPVVVLEKFDYRSQKIVADIGALLASSTLLRAPPKAPTASCMSEHDNGACSPLFAKLGLPFAGAAAPPQKFFSVR